MKHGKMIRRLILGGLFALAVLPAAAQNSPGFSLNVELGYRDDDYYRDHYFYDDEPIYRYGFLLNNYAGVYLKDFEVQIVREYRIPRSYVRYYLKQGFSPGDILFGAELARRTGYSFRSVMNRYFNSPDRNWVAISIDFGFPRGSAEFGLIEDAFRSHYRYWNGYHLKRHPHYPHPPVYRHPWSYFRPRPGAPDRHPSHSIRPGNQRPNRPHAEGGRRPGTTVPAQRPQTRPERPYHRPERPETRPSRRPGSGGSAARPESRPQQGGGKGTGGFSYKRRGTSSAPSGKQDSQKAEGQQSGGSGTYRRR